MRPVCPDVNQAQTLYIYIYARASKLFLSILSAGLFDTRALKRAPTPTLEQTTPPLFECPLRRVSAYGFRKQEMGALCIYEQHKEKQAHYTVKNRSSPLFLARFMFVLLSPVAGRLQTASTLSPVYMQ